MSYPQAYPEFKPLRQQVCNPRTAKKLPDFSNFAILLQEICNSIPPSIYKEKRKKYSKKRKELALWKTSLLTDLSLNEKSLKIFFQLKSFKPKPTNQLFLHTPSTPVNYQQLLDNKKFKRNFCL